MTKTRNVFLFGAGAALAWKGPYTSELTELIRNKGFKTKYDNTTITEFIYQKLISIGFSENDVNFETIINVIEELIVFYSNFDGQKKPPLPSLLGGFLTPKFEENLLNFSVEGGEVKHGYKLQIPAGEKYNFAKPANNGETPQQLFFQHLIGDLLSNICSRVSKYAYHTNTLSRISIDNCKSKNFANWMKTQSEKCILRLYTTNYDRIFKVLMEKEGIDVFEGFDCGEYIDSTEGLRANVPKILKDFDIHTHYNIHGSAFWEVKDLDDNKLPNPEIVLRDFANLPINNYPASLQIEKDKTLLVTNIVTGYQKAQRAMITPFKQMQSAFDRDCCFADKIYVIGYSFGDEHINQSIKNAMRYNEKVEIEIVDPSFIKNKMDESLAKTIFSYCNLDELHPVNINENICGYFDGKVLVNTIGFDEFLENF